MKVRLASPRQRHRRRPLGRFTYEPASADMPAGLHLNRLGDRPGRPGRHIIGCWLKIGRSYLSWVWPIRFEGRPMNAGKRKPWEANGAGHHVIGGVIAVGAVGLQVAVEAVTAVSETFWGGVGLVLLITGWRGRRRG